MAAYAFSAYDIHNATESALATLAWSEPDWSEVDEYGNPAHEALDQTDAEWSDAAIVTVHARLGAFMEDDRVIRLFHLLDLCRLPYSPGQIGHDYILTANHHGAGFWDRDYRDRPRAALDLLSQIAQGDGEIRAYLSDAGELEVTA